jgi:hypothetical protein
MTSRVPVAVQDDGKGIDPAVLSGRGSEDIMACTACRNARRSSPEADGVEQADAGTEVELRIPATKSYVASRKHSWFSRRFWERQSRRRNR